MHCSAVGLLFLVSSLGVNGLIKSSYHQRPSLLPPQDSEADATNMVTKWLELPVDHFNQNNNAKWKMRYMLNEHFFKKDGPIFLLVGEETALSDAFLKHSVMVDIGRSLGGYLVANEHRYYGESQPIKNPSIPDIMQYMNVNQTMADIAQLIRTLKTEKRFANSPVVIFGGSYAGMLCVWAKMTYPDLIDAAVASSAPIKAVADYYGYLEIINNVLVTEGSQKCVDVIKEGIENLEEFLKNPDGVKKVSDMFKAENTINTKNPLNIQSFFFSIIETISKTVQYAENVTTVQELCRFLVDPSNGSPELRIAKFVSTSKRGFKVEEYDNVVKNMRNVTHISRIWGFESIFYYHRCSEVAYFYSTTSKKQPFGDNTPFSFFADHLCPDTFGKEFNRELIVSRAKGLNDRFGGIHPNVTKVVFVNGSLDPWHGLGVTKNLSDDAPAIFINGSSHSADMYATSPFDIKELREAKEKIKTLVTKWVNEARK